MERKLILASASPRRKELLESIKLPFVVFNIDVDETRQENEKPQEMVARLSNIKAHVVAERFPDAVVLGADTTVVLTDNGKELVLGKPQDEDDACRMLGLLSGRSHFVFTGYSIIGLHAGIDQSRVVKTTVTFVDLSAELIRSYVASREPMDKAGAYGAQGIGSAFISRIDGSYTNVVGLPLAEVRSDLEVLGLWQPQNIAGR